MDEIFFQITFSGDNGIFYVCFQPIKTKWSWSERQCICWACYRHSFHNNNNYHYCVSLLPASENSGCHSAYQGRKQVSWIEMWTCESHWFWWFRYIRVLMKSRLGIHSTSIVLNLRYIRRSLIFILWLGFYFQGCRFVLLDRILSDSSVDFSNRHFCNVGECYNEYPILRLTWWYWSSSRFACMFLLISVQQCFEI